MDNITKGERCSATVFADRGPSSRCQKPAKVERGGKLYCTIHDPAYIKEKQQKWQEKFDREWNERQKGYDRSDAVARACFGLNTATLKKLNPHLIAQAPRMIEFIQLLAGNGNQEAKDFIQTLDL